MEKSAIHVSHLTKRYEIGANRFDTNAREQILNALRSVWRRRRPEIITVLNDLSFDISQGEIVGIIGSNGAGKSTLLKILSRVTFPTSGKVQVSGRVASLLEVGTGFHDELTGRENIYLNGSILGMKKAQITARFDEIVEYSGVEKFLDTPIKRYSSGMRLRLGFAVAAHLDPDVLIVDEVLAVGDAAFQRKCLKTMEGLRNSGRTVLFVSHNVGAVEALCSRAIWLQAGGIKLDGPAREVTKQYMSSNVDVVGGSVTLKDAAGRPGNGEVRLTRVEILDSSGQILNIIQAGDPMTIRFYYSAARPLGNLSIGYRINTEFGSGVTESSTRLHDIELPRIAPGDGHIDIDIPAMNLMPGVYYLSAGITTIGGPIHDTAENCLQLEMLPGKVYGTGRVIDNTHGVAFFPQTWKLDGVRRAAEQ